MKIAILTSPAQWFISYAKVLHEYFTGSKLFFDHKKISENFDIVFILSYHKIIPEIFLKHHKHNIVVHASALPEGKGWAPLFWQVLEGKNEIPFTLFEAGGGVDSGEIYLKSPLFLTGYELNAELREKQALHTIEMCKTFVHDYKKISKYPQSGQDTFYPKRNSQDSRLDPDKTIREQFNLLRIVNNEEYPAFFEIDGHRYVLKIEEDNHENR